MPDYCEPTAFRYKLCKLRLRGRRKTNDIYTCPDSHFCEEVDCEGKCWLPAECRCAADGKFQGRMMCTEDCFAHSSSQWGLCVPVPDGEELTDEDEPVQTHFHFYTQNEMLYNAKLHIDESSPMRRTPDPVESHDEL